MRTLPQWRPTWQRLRHRNLVTLLGFSSDLGQRLLVFSKHALCPSLYWHLHDPSAARTPHVGRARGHLPSGSPAPSSQCTPPLPPPTPPPTSHLPHPPLPRPHPPTLTSPSLTSPTLTSSTLTSPSLTSPALTSPPNLLCASQKDGPDCLTQVDPSDLLCTGSWVLGNSVNVALRGWLAALCCLVLTCWELCVV